MPGLGAREQPLHLVELGVGLLQLGRFAGEHVEPVVIADRHLVGEPAQIPRELGDALGELTAAAAEIPIEPGTPEPSGLLRAPGRGESPDGQEHAGRRRVFRAADWAPFGEASPAISRFRSVRRRAR